MGTLDWNQRGVTAHLELVRKFFDESGRQLEILAKTMAESLARGGKILFFGNGGSAADAQHLAAELVNRMARDRAALSAIALTTDTSILTSIANDAGYHQVFSRQIEALGRAPDVAFSLSTSGHSPNILLALSRARELGLTTASFLGRDGGDARSLSDHALIVEDDSTARIQEVHMLAGHLLCEEIERLACPPAGP